ncbi:MAG: hypothetical protein P0Y53_09840 [Candidatus Pseudobacter hemicellulosilyticus]|uniref:Late embryogenesis abundant protein n=1 Tax=Candidatus Pseudobacter hemicellulosilyticus TaxID=3121375 RepID=A0AAJ6BHZ5_9BACT|nr:MAG: hypothetical protein P0Y53_09840 [Pseudobacter sp.]
MLFTTLRSLAAGLCLCISSIGFAQSKCDSLRKEIEYLKKALYITTPTKTINSSKIDFNLIKCIGNTKEQTVELQLTVVNRDANRTLQFSGLDAIDLEGNQYDHSRILLGTQTYRNTIYTDVPLKAVLTLKKVLPSVKMFKIVPVGYYDEKSRVITIEFKDLPIVWQ